VTREDWLADPECKAGWMPLLNELDERLRAQWPDYTIDQVKEKFGTLRFYAQLGIPIPDEDDDQYAQWVVNYDAFHAIIAEYEGKSAEVCEACGKLGKLGDRNFWWVTSCEDCAPDGWVASDVECVHASITSDTCNDCGRERVGRLEHSDVVLVGVHPEGTCLGEHCTIHNRSSHAMRGFVQQWRSDRRIMERICTHGVGHPDPDEFKLTRMNRHAELVHGCDGCCGGSQ